LKENRTRKYKLVLDKLPAFISSAFLLAAVFGRWPYGFYTFVRLIVCGCAVYLAVRTKTVRSTAWPWILGGMAVLFNPICPDADAPKRLEDYRLSCGSSSVRFSGVGLSPDLFSGLGAESHATPIYPLGIGVVTQNCAAVAGSRPPYEMG
jgi:hypothetical protein